MKADMPVQTDEGLQAFAGSAAEASRRTVPRSGRADDGVAPGTAVAAQAPRARWLRVLRRRKTEGALSLVSLSTVLVVWFLLTHYRVNLYVRFANIPSPVDALQAFIQMNRTSAYADNVLISLRRILAGFGVAALLGVSGGLLIGRYRLVRALCFPALEALRPIPAIAWVPISVMLWPSNESSIVFITFIGAFFPILLNTVEGVQAIDEVLVRAASTLGASEGALFRHVVLPGALPHIFTGLALGMGVAWVSLIAAEMISGQFGIGYATWEAYSLISYPDIVVGMVTIGLLGWICSGLIRFTGAMVMPWRAFSTRRGR
ncbi:ABC transporter permease [Paraburkholderia phosphatilytica]|uniref:ABC transporter permease n=1 Tax=Paraburkholderia phosphatilytica TaxID=2282883 RepID=UPI000E4916F1|nr:ABC transporter permease [Paraburkholderia phosphatilytica]